LGYEEDEFTMKLILGDFLHPKQKTLATIIIQSVVSYAVEGKYNKHNSRFVMLYKVKHKDGKYKTILRQTNALEIDKNNRMISNYSIITDVTGIIKSDKIEWRLEGGKPGFSKLVNKRIEDSTKKIFSKTELKIFNELKKGKTSKEIAIEWGNSHLTINTHRRNMLNRSNCKNTPELLLFGSSIGL
jgi:DNA-binding CsgD family transcriptional regulator